MKMSQGGGDFELAPEGTHNARYYSVIDIGLQKGEYKGEVKENFQAIAGIELVDTAMEDGRPFVMSKFYTLSLDTRSNLYKDIKGMVGKQIDKVVEKVNEEGLKLLLDRPCQVVVAHEEKNGKERAVITVILPAPKGKNSVAPLKNAIEYFDMDDPNWEAFGRLPEWKAKFIDKSKCALADMANNQDQQPQNDDPDDDIPW